MKKIKVVLAAATLASALTVMTPSPAQASCGPVIIEACRIVCKVGGNAPVIGPTVYRVCTVL